jgi:beta-glucosidase
VPHNPARRSIDRRTFLAASAAVGVAGVLAGRVDAAAVPRSGPKPDDSPDGRAAALVAQMTLDEKISLVHGTPSATYIGYVPGIARLGIPDLLLTDGPAGIRTPKQTSGPSTAFPAPIALAASFDGALARRVGTAFGSEAKAKKQSVVFAPIVNLARVPEGGRLFEGFGEDPVLTGLMGAQVTAGIQSMGVVATVKHWICNDQEDNRHVVSVEVDERTLREVYLPPFIAAIRDGGAGAVMAANNGVNGKYNAQNPELLRDLLKGELGFLGFVCSDYAATHDPVLAANGGLDLDLPTGDNFGEPLKQAVQDGTVPLAVLDDKVHRILRTIIALGILDGGGTSALGGPGSANTAEHAALAQEVTERGTVLLKNDSVGAAPPLPLDPARALRIAAVGPYAATPRIGGDGSSHVAPASAVSPVDGIRARFAQATVDTAPGAYADYVTVPTGVLTPAGGRTGQGLLGEYFANRDFAGTPALTRVDKTVSGNWNANGPGSGLPSENFSVRWTGTLTPTTTGQHTLATQSDDDSRVYIGGTLVVDNWGEHDVRQRSAPIDLVAGKAYDIRVEYVQRTFRASVVLQWILPADSLIAEAATIAGQADVALVFVSDVESEGIDRQSLALPGQQDALVAAVAAANPRTVVVSNAGGPILMPWLDDVPTVLVAWYVGQQDGDALARLLAGDISPAGRLPVTFGRSAADYPARTPTQYPGMAATSGQQADLDFTEQYSEGALIGYRHFDARRVEPMFCFGHGLSYSSFEYGPVRVAASGHAGENVRASATVTVHNAGDVAADEVVQLYLSAIDDRSAPPQVLRSFRRVHLAPGERQPVHFELDASDFARWDTRRHGWVVEPGRYEVRIGASSRDIRSRATVRLR